MPTSSRIIADYRAQVAETRRRGANAYLFRTLLSNLRGHGMVLHADLLERKIGEIDRVRSDPAVDPTILKLYRLADRRLADCHGARHQRLPSSSVEAERARELWATFSRAASSLASGPMRCRLVMVTLTVSSRMSWDARLSLIDARLKQVRKVAARHALWYAEALDVQGPQSGHSPHAHLLYLLEEEACAPIVEAIRALPFRTHVQSHDHLDRDRRRALLADWMRRRKWLEALAYVMKVSGKCDRYRFLPPDWDVEFEKLRTAFKQNDGSHAVAVKAVYAYYAGGRRIFRIANKVKVAGTIPRATISLSTVNSRRGMPEAPSKIARRGRQESKITEDTLKQICENHASMAERAAAAHMTEKTFRKLMVKFGIPTPRLKVRAVSPANGKNDRVCEKLVLLT